jgi:hypothetical protein
MTQDGLVDRLWRDGPAPGEGPADRPAETTTTTGSSTGVNPQGPIDPDMPDLPPGDQGG